MPPHQPVLQLMPDRWYGWQMIPGYSSEQYDPYFSPILVRRVTPKKTGQRILSLSFINAFYVEGMEVFNLDMRILKHEKHYLIADLLYGADIGYDDRVAVISAMEFGWIRRCCPELWQSRPPTSVGPAAENSVTEYLNGVFQI